MQYFHFLSGLTTIGSDFHRSRGGGHLWLLFILKVCFQTCAMQHCSLWDPGSEAGGRARAPVVGAPSPNHWTNREPQTPGNINPSETAQRSSSQHQDPALSDACKIQCCKPQAKQPVRQEYSTTHQRNKKNEMTCYR